METRIKTSGFSITSAISTYLDSRLVHIAKLLGAEGENVRCEAELGRDAGRPRHGAHIWFAELQLVRPGASTLRATNRSESINGAIDDAKAELERQVRSDKRLATRGNRREGRKAKGILRQE